MARIRSIKPEFFTSESIGALSLHARLTFAGLWTYVDDRGRAKDNPRVIRGALWPNDEETVSSADVADFISELVKHDMVCRYAVGGRDYLHVINMRKHQAINKPSASKLPECPVHDGPTSPPPPVALPEPSGTTPAALPEDSRGEVEVEVEVEQGSGTSLSPTAPTRPPLPDVVPDELLATLAESSPGFEDFWNHWPRKSDKAPAEKAFAKAIKKARSTVIVEACRAYAERCREVEQDPQFIPLATTWLNKERWNDDLDAAMPIPRQRKSTEHVAYQNSTAPDAYDGDF